MERTRIDKAFSVMFRVLGAFVFICFASYFVKLIISPEGTLPWIATTLVMTFTAGPYLLRRVLRRALKRAYLPFKIAFCVAFLVFTLTFSALIAYLYLPHEEAQVNGDGADVVYLVFGARVKESGPTKTLAARLDIAADGLLSHTGALCIVSGGRGSNEPVSEAEAMRDYLIAQGVEEKRIILEDEATDTIENVDLSLLVAEREEISDRRIVCVSSDTHIPRIRLICASRGIDAQYLCAPTPHKEFLFTTWVREYLSFIKMFLKV